MSVQCTSMSAGVRIVRWSLDERQEMLGIGEFAAERAAETEDGVVFDFLRRRQARGVKFAATIGDNPMFWTGRNRNGKPGRDGAAEFACTLFNHFLLLVLPPSLLFILPPLNVIDLEDPPTPLHNALCRARRLPFTPSLSTQAPNPTPAGIGLSPGNAYSHTLFRILFPRN